MKGSLKTQQHFVQCSVHFPQSLVANTQNASGFSHNSLSWFSSPVLIHIHYKTHASLYLAFLQNQTSYRLLIALSLTCRIKVGFLILSPEGVFISPTCCKKCLTMAAVCIIKELFDLPLALKLSEWLVLKAESCYWQIGKFFWANVWVIFHHFHNFLQFLPIFFTKFPFPQYNFIHFH